LSAQSASQRRSARNITDQVDRSGSSRSIGIKLAPGGGSLRARALSRGSVGTLCGTGHCLAADRQNDSPVSRTLPLQPSLPLGPPHLPSLLTCQAAAQHETCIRGEGAEPAPFFRTTTKRGGERGGPTHALPPAGRRGARQMGTLGVHRGVHGLLRRSGLGNAHRGGDAGGGGGGATTTGCEGPASDGPMWQPDSAPSSSALLVRATPRYGGCPPPPLRLPARGASAADGPDRHGQLRCRGEKGVGRGKGCCLRHSSGSGPPASRDAHGRGRHSAAQRTRAQRAGRPTRRTGGQVGSTAARWGASNRAARWRHQPPPATEAGAQARSPAGHRGRVKPRMSLRAVAVRNSWRWGWRGGRRRPGPVTLVAGQSFSATYSRSPKNPALQLLQKSSKSASAGL